MSVLVLVNELLRFTLREDSSGELVNLKTGRVLRMGPVVYQEEGPIDVGHVWLRRDRSLCEQYPGRFHVAKEGENLRITVIGLLGAIQGTFLCRFELEHEKLVFTLLSVDESLPSLIYPPALQCSSLVIPDGVGQWIRNPGHVRRIIRFYSGINMRWFGGLAENNEDGWIAIFSKKHEDAGISRNMTNASPVHFRSLGTWADESFPRVIQYQFTQDGYVGQAKTFRTFAIQNGLHKSLRQKVQETPNLETLVGGRELNCYLGDSNSQPRCEDRLQDVPEGISLSPIPTARITCEEVIEMAAQAKSLGCTKGLVMLRGWINGGYDESHPDVWPPEPSFGTLQQYGEILSGTSGYLGGIHDNYGDMYASVPSFPNGTLKTSGGKPKRGGYWSGGQCYLLDPRSGLEYARRNWENIQTLKPSKVYSDTITAMYLEESFDPDCSLTRAQDYMGKQALMSFFKSKGVILASEEGADIGGALLDTADTQHHRDSSDEMITIPLWPLVYHDAILCGRHNTTVSDRQSATPWDVATMLWGYYPMWAIPDAKTWREGFVESFRVEELHRRIAFDEMLSHRFLDENCLVEETTFENGIRVQANFGSTDFWGLDGCVPAHDVIVIG